MKNVGHAATIDFAGHELAVSDLRLNCAEGPAFGPPLVLLHGSTGSWQGYRELMARLAPKWHVFACDLRGHGKSGRDGDRYRLTDYVGDIAKFVEAQFEPAVVLGHSLGALVALGVTARAPKSTRALVLLDPPLYLRNSPVSLRSEVAEWFTWVYEMMRSRPSLCVVVEACRALQPSAPEQDLLELAERVSRVAPESVEIVLRDSLLEGVDLGEIVRQVRQPTLLIRDDWAFGGAVREEDVDWFRSLVPQTCLARISRGNHCFLWDHPEATTRAIEDFLSLLR